MAATFYSWAEVANVDAPTVYFVSQLYRDLLHREADNGGLVNFGNLVQRGVLTRTQVALAIQHSMEYQTNEVEDLYARLLGRQADAGGLNAFVTFLHAGGAVLQVETAMLSSPEYLRHAGGTNAGFVNALYHDVLHRDADVAGAALWEAFLGLGASRARVATSILTSAESEQDIVFAFYEHSLHRPADTAGATGFVSALGHGMTEEVIQAMIMGSAEYLARASG
jgi:hypothetical protein